MTTTPPPAADSAQPSESGDFERLEALFDRVARLPPSDRRRIVDAECADRPDLKRSLDELLAAHDRLGDGDEPVGPEIGSIVGAYRLVERIGAGGMGEVYRAERADGSFTQVVAVKLTRSVLAPGDARRRFKIERQILASLQHPHIVRLLDGGTTAEGQAYFVMELVAGVPITRFCRDRRLPLAARVRLVRDVCDAVQHAHEHGVIHRDLKPANILVTADGAVKVLDFGVAKVVEGAPVAAPETRALLVPLTPNYASPEQLKGLAVTTAADVYALGVLLYEVLSGARPYETDGQPLDRVLDIVLNDIPARPSAAAGVLPYAPRALRGDLDAIVLTALGKTPAERYRSASELSADLTRWLEQQPVVARGASPLYLLRRLAARHLPVVTVAALALVAVVTASIYAWTQGIVARQEQARAERRFAEVRSIASSVLFDYQGSLRELGGAAELRARMIADSLRYLDALAAEGPAAPDLELEIARGYVTISEVQGAARMASLGDRASALASLHKAEALLADLAARHPSFEVSVLQGSMPCYFARVDPSRAAEHVQRCLANVAPLVAEQPANASLHTVLGQAHVRLAETGSEEHAREAIALLSQPVPAPPQTARFNALLLAYAHRLLGWRLFERGEIAEALAHGEAAAAILDPLVTANGAVERRLDQAFTLQLIGRSATALGDGARARAALERAVRLLESAHADSPADAFIQDRLAQAYRMAALGFEAVGDVRGAAEVYREAAGRLPSLTAPFEEPTRDWTRGALYAGHALLNFADPPCELLALADGHLRAARAAGTVPAVWNARVERIASLLARCGTEADAAAR